MQDGNGGVCPAEVTRSEKEWVNFGRGWIWKGQLISLGPSSGPAKVLVPRVRTRAPGFFTPVEEWKRVSVETRGVYEPFEGRDQGVKKFAARTQWPPLRGQAVYGWRAWWIAQRIINWRHQAPKSRYFRKMTWCELFQVAKGRAGFRWYLWQRVLNDIEWKAQSEKEKLRAFRATPYAGRGQRSLWKLALSVEGGSVQAALEPVPRVTTPRAPRPGRAMKTPSQWNEGR
jgi:hypothetical protein